MTEDSELLRQYHEGRSERAFAELVDRHLALVYHSALRQLNGDRHWAEDISQLVFIDLARKAGSLLHHPVLAGWLYRSTRFAAAQVQRSERRRRKREQAVSTMHDLLADSSSAAEWERLRPVIDDVIHSLSAREQQIVFLRFFSGQPYAAIGARLGLTADAARFRADRALEKMRLLLSKRGLESTGAALAMALTAQACPAIPLGLAAAVNGAALAGAAASGSGTFLQIMLTYKQIALAGTLIAVGGTFAVTESVKQRALHQEIALLADQSRDLAQAIAENQRLRALQSNLRTEASAQSIAVQHQTPSGTKPAGSPVIIATSLDQTPVPIDRAPPNYPEDLKASGLHPTITVDCIVDTTGSVRNAYAVNPGPPAKTGLVVMMDNYNASGAKPDSGETLSPEAQTEFNHEAVRAVGQWIFLPGRHTGRSVNTHLQVPVTFGPPESFVPPSS